MIPTEFIGSVERGSGDKNNPKGSPNKIANEGIWELPVWGGGSKPLPGWFGATFFGRLCFILGGSRPLPGWFGALFLEMKCPRVAQSAHLSAGGVARPMLE